MVGKYLYQAILLFLIAFILKIFNCPSFIYKVPLLASYILAGSKVLISTFKSFINTKLIDERFLISISTIGALLINHHFEGVFVMIFYDVSISFQQYIMDKSNKNIPSLLDVKLSYAEELPYNKTNLTTLFTYYYNPVILITALLLAFVPPLFLSNGSYDEWICRSFCFLIISCPCVLILSIPISFFYGLSKDNKYNVLIKRISLLKSLKNLKTIIYNEEDISDNNLYKCQLSLKREPIIYEPIIEKCDIDYYIKSSDIIIITKNSLEIVNAIKGTKHTLLVSRQNIILALGIKIILLILSVFGLICMSIGIIVDLFVLIIIFINSILPVPKKM